MKTKRLNHSAQLKAKVTLVVAKGDKTINGEREGRPKPTRQSSTLLWVDEIYR